jgi:hypothetical protein
MKNERVTIGGYLDTVILAGTDKNGLSWDPLDCDDGSIMGTANDMQETTAGVEIP